MKYLASFVLLVVFTGCATGFKPQHDYREDYNFSKLKTYAIAPVHDGSQNSPYFSDIEKNRLENALRDGLTNLGMQETDVDNADFRVSYIVLTENKQDIRTYNTGIGYAGAGWRCRGCMYSGGVTHVETRDYQEGTLIVDFVANDIDQSVWRSTVSARIKNLKSEEKREQRVWEVVQAVLSGYPPGAAQ